MKSGINRISGREDTYQQCAAQKPEWFLFPAAPDEGFGQCGETSWNCSQGSSWECGNNIKINTLVFNNLLPSEAAGGPGRSWGSLDKAGQLGIPPYCSKWLGVWHRPYTVATVHIPSPPFTLQESWETLADKRISKSQAFSLFRSGKQYKVIVCILCKCLLCLLAFFFFPFAGAGQFWSLYFCTPAERISSFLSLSLYKRGCISGIMLIQAVGRQQPVTA